MQEFSFEWDNNHKNENVYFSPYTALWNINLNSTSNTKPALYNILLLWEDHASVDFVTKIIEIFFNKTHKESASMIEEIKCNGQILCDCFPKDIADTKMQQIRDYCALHNQHVKCAMERRP